MITRDRIFLDGHRLHPGEGDNLEWFRNYVFTAGFNAWSTPPARLLEKTGPGQFFHGGFADSPAFLFIGDDGVCVLAVQYPDMPIGVRLEHRIEQIRERGLLPSDCRGNAWDMNYNNKSEVIAAIDAVATAMLDHIVHMEED